MLKANDIYLRSGLSKKYPKYLYSEICKEFNSICIDQIIKENKSFSLGYNLGRIIIQEKENTKLRKGKLNEDVLVGRIDWYQSKLRKQELINKGITPYQAITDESGKIIGDNGGEKWFVYNLDDYKVVVTWVHNRIKKDDEMRFISKSSMFKYKAAFHFVRAMSKYRRESGKSYIVASYDL